MSRRIFLWWPVRLSKCVMLFICLTHSSHLNSADFAQKAHLVNADVWMLWLVGLFDFYMSTLLNKSCWSEKNVCLCRGINCGQGSFNLFPWQPLTDTQNRRCCDKRFGFAWNTHIAEHRKYLSTCILLSKYIRLSIVNTLVSIACAVWNDPEIFIV